MAKIIKIQNTDKALSKEQKAFNNYIKNIKEAKENFEHLKEVNQWLLSKGNTIIRPSHDKLMNIQKKLLFQLDASPFAEKLPKKLFQKYEAIILEGLTLMINGSVDEQLISLYNKYNKVTFQDEKANELGMINELVGKMFGIDADFTKEELENPILMEQKMKEIQAQKEAEEEERKANRKLTAKQLEKEAKTKEAEKKLTQTTKKIYLELVKNFHPDQEQDEAEREKKTAILQEANAAYANDDFLTLLELQIKLFQEKEENLSKTSDETLKYYNKILKEQLQELKYKLSGLNPYSNGHPYGDFYNPTHTTLIEKDMKKEAKRKEAMVVSFEQQIRQLKDLQSFKDYIKDFELMEEEDDFDMSGLFNLFAK